MLCPLHKRSFYARHYCWRQGYSYCIITTLYCATTHALINNLFRRISIFSLFSPQFKIGQFFTRLLHLHGVFNKAFFFTKTRIVHTRARVLNQKNRRFLSKTSIYLWNVVFKHVIISRQLSTAGNVGIKMYVSRRTSFSTALPFLPNVSFFTTFLLLTVPHFLILTFSVQKCSSYQYYNPFFLRRLDCKYSRIFHFVSQCFSIFVFIV